MSKKKKNQRTTLEKVYEITVARPHKIIRKYCPNFRSLYSCPQNAHQIRFRNFLCPTHCSEFTNSFSNSLSYDAFIKFHELFILTCSKQKKSVRQFKAQRSHTIRITDAEKVTASKISICRTISRYSLLVLLVATRFEKTRTDCTFFVHESEFHKAKIQSLNRTVQNVPRDSPVPKSCTNTLPACIPQCCTILFRTHFSQIAESNMNFI